MLNPIFGLLYANKPSCIPPFRHRIRKILSCHSIENIIPLPEEEPLPPWSNFNICTIDDLNNLPKQDTPHFVYLQLFYFHRQRYKDFNSASTDGSKAENHVGSAAVFNNLTKSERLHSYCKVFTSEIYAIFMILSKLRSSKGKKCIIYTDSRSSLEALLHISRQSHPLVNKVFNLYTSLLGEGYSILVCWIPGHIGIIGNEKADSAAREARRISWPYVPLPDIDRILKSKIRRSWQEIWDAQINNKLHFIQPSLRGFKAFNFNRNINVKLVRLRIGHTYFTHQNLLHSEPTPTCQTCNANYTVRHILSECEIFNNCRNKWFGKAHPQLHELLGDPPHFNLFSFVVEIGFMKVI
ncbi:hypothetical protein AVEN_222700-1 [Araneus ventricosus]|uniref:RNase H type-1 domain-containing protein n=1 Tax=Araneus ventricosus TaxID=182803 RepID=A0A4Y2B2C6_ARAVE|nr:hypothetical protein AVEN_222700-1 [Araneus ventricosus]